MKQAMRNARRRLAISAQTLRALSTAEASAVRSATALVATGMAATNGDTGCLSEAGGCPSGGWSCINYSCCQ